jgi:hypothetical protein
LLTCLESDRWISQRLRTLKYFYIAYGLHCLANSSIPGLQTESARLVPPDVVLELGFRIPEWVRYARTLPSVSRYARRADPIAGDPAYTFSVRGESEFFELIYSDGVEVVINGVANRIWAGYPPSLTIDDLAVYLRGPIMGFVLRRRGVISLHASALSCPEGAVVLCGESAVGKSTTAAALALKGLSVLSDDITALKEGDCDFQVEPGYPRVCLWPAAVQQLLGAADALPRLTSSWEKCFLPLDGTRASFEGRRRPLLTIYLLAPSPTPIEAPRIEKMSSREALLALVQNTYMNWLLDRKQRAMEFDLLTRLVSKVPVCRVVSDHDSGSLSSVCEQLVRDTERLFARRDPQYSPGA